MNLVFQSYHLMVAMYGLIMLTVDPGARVHAAQGRAASRSMQLAPGGCVLVSPGVPVRRHPDGMDHRRSGPPALGGVSLHVSGPDGVSLLTNDAISQSVSAPELSG